MICYETPLNERARTLLRLEFMFEQFEIALQGDSTWHSRMALQLYFDALNVITKNELKPDLLKELDRHFANLSRLSESPGVDPHALTQILDEIVSAREGLHQAGALAVDQVRHIEFLNAIKQRRAIPAGTCCFDLPGLHHWLESNNPAMRREQLTAWCGPLHPLRTATELVLELIRGSAVTEQVSATNGFFQMKLEPTAPTQMVRIFVAPSSDVFPEVSGGKHRFSVRFLDQSDPNQRPKAAERDISFELSCCII